MRDDSSRSIYDMDVTGFEKDANVILVVWMEAQADDRSPDAATDMLSLVIPVIVPFIVSG